MNKDVSSIVAIVLLSVGSLYSAQMSHVTTNDWDILLKAIEQGDSSRVQNIVPSKIKAYEKTRGGRYLFAIARHGNKNDITEYLAWQAILPAIENNMVDVVEELVGKNYISADAQTKGGRSLSQIARHHNKTAIVDYLQSQLKSTNAGPVTAQLTNTGPIEFYEKNDPYYEFTNFYQGKQINLDGKLWPTSEHYFQAMKFIGPNSYVQEKIRTTPSPRDVFTLANGRTGTYKHLIRPDWDSVKDTIMYQVVFCKFSQDEQLKKLLVSTAPRKLIEASPVDPYWGYGSDKKGKNMLGKTLMQVRDELQSKTGTKTTACKKVSSWSPEHQKIASMLEETVERNLCSKCNESAQALKRALELVKKIKQAGVDLHVANNNGNTLHQIALGGVDVMGGIPTYLKTDMDELLTLLK
jgi:ribA/ribD-fused uncharacterized protein